MNAPIDRHTTLEFARSELAGKLLKACIGHLESLQTPWNMTSADTQEIVINAMSQGIKQAVHEAVNVIISDSKPYIKAKLESVTFKDGIKATLAIGGGTAGRHDLADAAGNSVLIVISPAEDYTTGTQKVKAQDDQRPLDLVEGERPSADAGRHAHPPEYQVKQLANEKFVVRKDAMPIPGAPVDFETQAAAEDWLQEHLSVGKHKPDPESPAEPAGELQSEGDPGSLLDQPAPVKLQDPDIEAITAECRKWGADEAAKENPDWDAAYAALQKMLSERYTTEWYEENIDAMELAFADGWERSGS